MCPIDRPRLALHCVQNPVIEPSKSCRRACQRACGRAVQELVQELAEELVKRACRRAVEELSTLRSGPESIHRSMQEDSTLIPTRKSLFLSADSCSSPRTIATPFGTPGPKLLPYLERSCFLFICSDRRSATRSQMKGQRLLKRDTTLGWQPK
jgi:hypothetical protein